MKLSSEQAAELRSIEDTSIDRTISNGRVDHNAAARALRDRLAEMEVAGQSWISAVRDAAEMDGLLKRIKSRTKSRRVSLPAKDGRSTVSLPAFYSQRDADGAYQMSLWFDMPIDDLADLIETMDRQAAVLTDHALSMRYGLDLARKHGVTTAREGFRAEGIDIAAA